MSPTVNTNKILNPEPIIGENPIAHRSEYETATGEEPIGVSFNDGGGVLKLIIVLIAVIGGLVLGFAFLFRTTDKSVNNTGDSALTEHTQVMREAVQLAREAQELNRQRMAELQKMQMDMEMGEREYVDGQLIGEPPPE
jgi:uncharacterized protein HemX